MTMQTRSVRVNSDALMLADQVFALGKTSFSEFVRNAVNYVARTGTIPQLNEDPSATLPNNMLEYERRAAEITSRRREPAYANANVKDLLADALMEKYGN
jgi:antitoxin component of RelBE/YafQ-DinJ toxin-antitoxin module